MQSKTGYPLLPKGIIEEGMVHAQGKGFPLPLALRDVVIFTVIFFIKCLGKKMAFKSQKAFWCASGNAQKTLCSSYLFLLQIRCSTCIWDVGGRNCGLGRNGFPHVLRGRMRSSGSLRPTGTSELCSALSPEVFLSDALTGQFLPFADTDLKGTEIPAALSKENR